MNTIDLFDAALAAGRVELEARRNYLRALASRDAFATFGEYADHRAAARETMRAAQEAARAALEAYYAAEQVEHARIVADLAARDGFLAASDGPSTSCKNTLVHVSPAKADDFARAILAIAEGDELERGPWTVYRMDRVTWKAHFTGTHPDETGVFLDGADDVRAWAAEVAS